MDSDTGKDIVLSISGGAGLFPASCGACYVINNYIKEIHPTHNIKYAGVSSGSIVAISLCLGLSEDDMFYFYKKFIGFFDTFYKVPFTYWYQACRKFLQLLLPKEDSYKQFNNKLYIGITRLTLKGLIFEVISNYTSNDDLINTIITSGTLFPLSWTPFRIYNGRLAGDGGYIYNYVRLPNHYNIIFKFDHINGVFNTSDWLISTSLDKWHRLFTGGQKHIKKNKNDWKKIITNKQETKVLLSQQNETTNKKNILITAYKLYKLLINNITFFKIITLIITLYLFQKYRKIKSNIKV